MKKWSVIIILAAAQFVMVLDSTVMNVSISEVVADLNTTVAGLQMAITFYTLTMAALMLLGGKLGDKYGRLRIFRIGAVVYGIGSLITGLAPNLTVLIIGWSLIEGIGAILVIPAVAALVATNYSGKNRAVGYAILGGIAGAAAAAGPLIGGFVTTYFSWRYVFIGETVVMLLVLLASTKLVDKAKRSLERIDMQSVILSATGMLAMIYGMLQSKTWGWIQPHTKPVINGHEIAPLGISLSAYLMLIGALILYWFYRRQVMLETTKRNPLLKPSLLAIPRLRAGLSVLGAQYATIAAVFFVLPIYLQMTLGFDALKTGMKILPLSFGVIAFAIVGQRLSAKRPPRTIVRYGQIMLLVGTVVLLASISPELKGWVFGAGMALLGAGLGLLASQLGNVNMSSVDAESSGEVGGMQGVAQNLGSSIGTALIGSVLIASLGSNFNQSVSASDLPSQVKSQVATITQQGVEIVPASDVTALAQSKGLPQSQSDQLSELYNQAQLDGLREALFAILLICILSIFLTRNLPTKRLT